MTACIVDWHVQLFLARHCGCLDCECATYHVNDSIVGSFAAKFSLRIESRSHWHCNSSRFPYAHRPPLMLPTPTPWRRRYAEVMGSLLIHQDPPFARTSDRRTFSANHYASTFTKSGAGIVHSRRWLGLTPAEELHLKYCGIPFYRPSIRTAHQLRTNV